MQLGSDKETILNNIDFLKGFIDKNAHIINQKQDDSELTSFIKMNYRVSEEDIDSILSILNSRKKSPGFTKRVRDKLISSLEAYCFVVNVRLYEKDKETGESFIDIDKLRKRLVAKKHQVKKMD